VALLWQGRWYSCTSYSVNALADLCIPVQLTEHIASRGNITAKLKNGIIAEESIQTGAGTSNHITTKYTQPVTVMLQKLQTKIKKKHHGQCSDSIILLHKNVHPHITHRVMDEPNSTCWEVFKRTAYSPVLLLSNFYFL